MSNRISVAEGQKPKPKPAFKFLRRDEGRLSYSAQPEPPGDTSNSTDDAARPRRDSKSLREAIARDMRTAKSHDPLGEVVVAMPKRAPPPNDSGAAAGGKPPVKRQPPSKGPAPKPSWVNPEVPDRHDDVADEIPSRGYVNSAPRAKESVNNAESDDAAREAAAYTAERQYEGGTPRVRGGAAAPAARRYVDPEPNYREDDIPVEKNYFRPQARAHSDYKDGCGTAVAAAAGRGGRGREEEELMVQLEDEIRAAQEERARYTRSKQQLDRERKRFEEFKYTSEQQLEDERAELESLRRNDQREAQRGVKSLEERYKSVSGLLATERDANRKLSDENDSLRAQLEELTATLRETQRATKAETTRLRRDLESLQKRNSELLTMTKESQIASLEAGRAPSEQRAAAPPPRLMATREASHPALKQPPHRQGSTSSTHETKASSSGSAPAPPLDFVEERTTSPRKGAHPHTQVVLDFSPRAKDEDAAERRAREVEERMRREEEEMQKRRQQRAQEAEERRKREEEEAAAAAAAMEVERVRIAKEKREALRKKKEELRKEEEELEAERETEKEKEKDVQQVAKERKASGHPATTPRTAAPATGASKKRSPSRTKEPSSSSSAPAPKRHIPTKRELLGDNEEIPAEEFPKDTIVSQTPAGESTNKREVLYRSGKREVHYANGTVKVVLPSGHTILHFTNGDVKRTYPSGKSTYWYDAAQTAHTQLPSGVQLFEFNATGQTERHLPDGTKEILYPDGIFKIVKADGLDETIFPEEK